MMQIRHCVFETNSSSVHSIVISKKKPLKLPKEIRFMSDEYAWGVEAASPISYFYTAILEYDDDTKERYLKRLKDILSDYGITSYFVDNGGYIDHSESLGNFVPYMLDHPQKLINFLFSEDSIVYTGNDNTETENEYATYYVGEPYIWTDGEEVPNPYHDEKHFEYRVKGN